MNPRFLADELAKPPFERPLVDGQDPFPDVLSAVPQELIDPYRSALRDAGLVGERNPSFTDQSSDSAESEEDAVLLLARSLALLARTAAEPGIVDRIAEARAEYSALRQALADGTSDAGR